MTKSFNKVIRKYEMLLSKLLNSRSFLLKEINDEFKKKTSSNHSVAGVYALFDKNDAVCYAGKTRDKFIIDRVGNQHIYGGASSDLRDMLGRPEIGRILEYSCRYVEIRDKKERSAFEHFVIAVIKPKLNKG